MPTFHDAIVVGAGPAGSTAAASLARRGRDVVLVHGLAADGRSIWVANSGSSTVTRLDRATGAVMVTYATGRGPFGVAFDGRNIWVANFGGSSVSTTLPAQ